MEYPLVIPYLITLIKIILITQIIPIKNLTADKGKIPPD